MSRAASVNHLHDRRSTIAGSISVAKNRYVCDRNDDSYDKKMSWVEMFVAMDDDTRCAKLSDLQSGN